MEERNYTVYKHTSPSGKVYIGITKQKPERRWRNGTAYKENDYFMKAIKKYGFDSFVHEIVYENLSKCDAESKEIELIKLYKSNNRRYGYNIANGGNSVGSLSEETKEKLRKARLGKKATEETKRKLSEMRKGEKNYNYGKRLNEQIKLKISKTRIKKGSAKGKNNPMYGKCGVLSPNYGKKHTEETKIKISESNKGKTVSVETREKISRTSKFNNSHKGGNNSQSQKVICITTNEMFECISDASQKYFNKNKSRIGSCCMGKTKYSGKLSDGTKLEWKYYKDYLK